MAQGFLGERVAGLPVAMVRMGVGVLFLIAGVGKFEQMVHWPDAVLGFLTGAEKTAFPFYSGFILVEKAHYELFAWLVALGEVTVGAALLLGAVSRFAALVGAFMVCNYWFAKGAGFWEPAGHDDLYILICVMLMFTTSGRVLGLDYFLSKKNPNLPLW